MHFREKSHPAVTCASPIDAAEQHVCLVQASPSALAPVASSLDLGDVAASGTCVGEDAQSPMEKVSVVAQAAHVEQLPSPSLPPPASAVSN